MRTIQSFASSSESNIADDTICQQAGIRRPCANRGLAKIESIRKPGIQALARILTGPAAHSGWGGFRLLGRFFRIENHDPAQIARMVGIEALLQSGIEAGELAGEDVRRQARQFWQLK